MKRKDDRNQAILEYCDNPRMTLRDIGMQFGITKQRVWAIRKAYQKIGGIYIRNNDDDVTLIGCYFSSPWGPQDGRQGVSESWLVRCYKSVMKVLRRGE